MALAPLPKGGVRNEGLERRLHRAAREGQGQGQVPLLAAARVHRARPAKRQVQMQDPPRRVHLHRGHQAFARVHSRDRGRPREVALGNHVRGLLRRGDTGQARQRQLHRDRMRRLESTLKAACMHIGKADLSKVTPEMLNTMYTAMRAGDTLSGSPWAAPTSGASTPRWA